MLKLILFFRPGKTKKSKSFGALPSGHIPFAHNHNRLLDEPIQSDNERRLQSGQRAAANHIAKFDIHESAHGLRRQVGLQQSHTARN